ncbi:MAG: hypothetical protein R3195_19740, partial [Gemmatimonadota bacterium]|nr:hypothetical protein [Gemmatimonadota bacterium]
MSDRADEPRSVLAELRHRKVFRVAVVYAAVGFVVIQLAELLVPALLLPDWVYRAVVLLGLLGFPVAIVLAWAFEVTPDGVRRSEAPAAGARRATVALFGLAAIVAAAGAWAFWPGDPDRMGAATDSARAPAEASGL